MNKVNCDSDFLRLRPRWNRHWERSEKDLAVILIPKFGDYALGRWLMSKLKEPHYRLKLDDIGTFVWRHCDGHHDVEEIGAKLQHHFGERVEPVYERLGVFLHQLANNKSIIWT